MSSIITISDKSFRTLRKQNERLTIVEEVAGNDFYTRKFKGNKDPKIIMFSIVEKLPDNRWRLTLPMHHINEILGVHVNDANKYPTADIRATCPLRDYQVPVFNEAMEQMNRYRSTTLSLYTGFGKTIMAIYVTAALGLKTVVVMNTEPLATQWVNTFQRHTTARVHLIDDENRVDETADVFVCMNLRVGKMSEKLRRSIGFLITDETHLLCTKSGMSYTNTSTNANGQSVSKTNVGVWLGFQPKYILLQTATLERPDGFHKIAHYSAGSHNVHREYKGKIFHVRWNTGIRPTRFIEDQYRELQAADQHDVARSLCNNERRNNMIAKICEIYSDKKILILTKMIDHCNLLTQVLKSRGIGADNMCGKKKSYKDDRVLVGTTKKIGTGFDQSSFCAEFDGIAFDMLIFTCYISSPTLLKQCSGRTFRAINPPVIIQLVDDDDKMRAIVRENWTDWYRHLNTELIEMKSGGIMTEDQADREIAEYNSQEEDVVMSD